MARFKKGDTLIEVILAFSVFSAAMVGGLWMMNNAMARAMASTQLTWARNEMDAQAEALRFINTRYVTARSSGATATDRRVSSWNSVIRNAVESASDLSSCSASRNAFVINYFQMDTGSVVSNNVSRATTYPRLAFSGAGGGDTASWRGMRTSMSGAEGLWIEAVSGPRRSATDATPQYYDFHIRACWIAPGQGAPTTLGTIVRLYNAN